MFGKGEYPNSTIIISCSIQLYLLVILNTTMFGFSVNLAVRRRTSGQRGEQDDPRAHVIYVSTYIQTIYFDYF